MFVLITTANAPTLRLLFRAVFKIKSTVASTRVSSSYPLQSNSKRKSVTGTGTKDRYVTLGDNTGNHSSAVHSVDKMYPLTSDSPPLDLENDNKGGGRDSQLGIVKNTEWTVSYDRP